MQVTLIENFRAVFYAPFYAAFALGAYRVEGVDVRLEMSTSVDKTLTGLLAGAGQVSWGGPMRVMRVRDESPQSDLVAFCEVVGRDPFYLIGRVPNTDFRMRDLVGKTLAVVTEVPTPWYCLQQDLRLAGIDPDTIQRAPDGSMSENLERLQNGAVDVIQVFEPFVQQAADREIGHRWYSAASRGLTSYTTLNSTRSFLEREPDTALRMTRAIYRTQKWLVSHDARELATAIADYFPHIPLATLATCCDLYRASGVWNTNPIQQRAGLEWLRDAMLACRAIQTKFTYDDLADMRFAEQVMREDPRSL